MRLNEDINYVKLDKKAESCMRITAAVILIILPAIATVLCLILWENCLLRNLLLAGGWILAAIYIVAAPKMRYARYRYCIDEESIRVSEGFVWVREQVVPIERLHKIARSQGPIARMFGLSTVKVTTAGGDVNIKFLTDQRADEISETLKKKINDMAVRERTGQ